MVNLDTLKTVNSDLQSFINAVNNVPVIGSFLVNSSKEMTNALDKAYANPTPTNVINAGATIGSKAVESFLAGLGSGAVAGIGGSVIVSAGSALSAALGGVSASTAAGGIAGGLGSGLISKMVIAGIITSALVPVIERPIEEVLSQAVPTKLLSPFILANAYGSGGISYDQLVNDPAFKILEPSDQAIVLTYASAKLNKSTETKANAQLKAYAGEVTKLVDKVDALNNAYFDKLISHYEQEVDKLHNEIIQLGDFESRETQGDLIQYYNKIVAPLEAQLGKHAVGADVIDPYISIISYDEYYNIASDILSSYLQDQAANGTLPNPDDAVAAVSSQLTTSPLITQAQLQYAKDSGYADTFNSSVVQIVNELRSSAGE